MVHQVLEGLKKPIISLNKNPISEITLLYRHYHKRLRLYKEAYKRFKTPDLLCNMSSSCLIVGGTIGGGVTTSPIVVGIILDSALIWKTHCEMKDFKKKIEFCRFAFITCVKTLIKLRFFLRGVSFDKESYLDQSKTRSYYHRHVFTGWCFRATVREVVYFCLINYYVFCFGHY